MGKGFELQSNRREQLFFFDVSYKMNFLWAVFFEDLKSSMEGWHLEIVSFHLVAAPKSLKI